MARTSVRVRVYGRVQGVWFRSSMKEMADELGLDGCVRNVEDGSVEAVIAGDEEKVNKLVEWCRVGPPHFPFWATGPKIHHSLTT
ncbi:MAG: acylphosphatase [Candidatus Caldarchaeum sp.]